MIELSILGGVGLTGGDPERLDGLLAQPKRIALLSYLTLARPRGFQNRDTLLALLWPELDSQHARWALNQAVHYLRGALGDGAVLRRGEDLSLDTARVRCDAIDLEAACGARRWDEAMALYQGELLPGLHLGGAVELEHWLDGERDRLRRLAAEAARKRAEELAAKAALPAAVASARDALLLDPNDESRVRRLIDLLAASLDRRSVRIEPIMPPPAPVASTPSGRAVRAGIAAAALAVLLGGVAFAIRLIAPKPLAITASELMQVTDEPGVEFQPAISSDGNEVAYTVGPVYYPHIVIRTTQTNPGGGEVRLGVETLSVEDLPMWSPGGDHVIFEGCRADRCAWYETAKLGGVIRPAKLPAQVTATASFFAWSPDGGRLVYASHETLFVAMAADSATPHPIAIEPVRIARPHSFAWSPDGTLIAYENGNAGWMGIGNLDRGSIWVVSSAGGTPRPVTGRDHLHVNPVWLDNRHLLFVSDMDGARGVYVVEVGPDGARGAPRLIPGVSDPHSISYAIGPQRLAWAKYTQRQNVWTYALGRTAPISIRDGAPVTSSNQVVELLDVSPDGKSLVFDSNRRGNQDLYKLSLVGGALVPLTDSRLDDASPRWSPNGTDIAFHAARTAGGSSLMVVPAAGGAPQALTNAPGLNVYPAWSPNGLHLAFGSTRSGRGQVWLLSRDSLGGAWDDAVPLSDYYYQVHDWAPDGRGVLIGDHAKIALVSPQGTVLWTRDLMASGLTEHWWGRFSPDGRLIYLVGEDRDGRRGVWAIPTRNGPPRLVIAVDDPALTFVGGIAVGSDRLYLAVSQYESDIWTAKLNW